MKDFDQSVDAQADLSLRWAYVSEDTFSRLINENALVFKKEYRVHVKQVLDCKTDKTVYLVPRGILSLGTRYHVVSCSPSGVFCPRGQDTAATVSCPPLISSNYFLVFVFLFSTSVFNVLYLLALIYRSYQFQFNFSYYLLSSDV